MWRLHLRRLSQAKAIPFFYLWSLSFMTLLVFLGGLLSLIPPIESEELRLRQERLLFWEEHCTISEEDRLRYSLEVPGINEAEMREIKAAELEAQERYEGSMVYLESEASPKALASAGNPKSKSLRRSSKGNT